MLGTSFQNRLDRTSGKAKKWVGRATGDARRKREGHIQSTVAGVKIKLRAATKRIVRMVRERRPNRSRR